jgi:hypothetical protein
VKQADGDEAEVPGDAERADGDEGDREDSHDVQSSLWREGGSERSEPGGRQRCSPGAGG